MFTEFQGRHDSYTRPADATADPAVLAASAHATDLVNQSDRPILKYVHLSASPVGGSSFLAGTQVTLSSDRPSTVIYYTTDGSDPTTASAQYSSPITVNSSQTIKALGVADGYLDGTISADYTVVSPPSIATQPQSQSVEEGSSATLTVAATGTAPLTYQWRKDNVNIDGATSTSYTINPAALDDAGDYTCRVTNAYGSATSAEATLAVTPAGVTPPSGATVKLTVGQSVTFPSSYDLTPGTAVTLGVNVAAGTTPLTYQWYKNNTILTGATSASLSVNAPGAYKYTATNSAGSTTSNTLTISGTASVSFDPAAGSYLQAPLGISIYTAAEGAQIRATFDGSTPTTGLPPTPTYYQLGSLQSVTIKAIAFGNGWATSVVQQGTWHTLV